MKDENGNIGGIDGYFFRLVATFEAAAMQQMGKIASPITGDVDVNLDGARDSIDMLGMLHRKCDGNLNEDEQRLIDHVLYQLRMNYVDASHEESESARDKVAGSGAPDEAAGTDAPDEAAGSDSAGADSSNGSSDEGTE